MWIAEKTLQAFEDKLYEDQGAAFRGLLQIALPQCSDAYRTDQDDFRNHLGASLIGRECARELWYTFRWSTKKKHPGRILRLFNRGHLEEPRFVALLQMIGAVVWQTDFNGKQFRILGHKGHFGGSMDAVCTNIPDVPGSPVLTEMKTHGEKSFIAVKAEGIINKKWEHYVQMQIYMGKNGLQYGLYLAVNKNTDEIHAEIIEFDMATYNRYIDRSVMIIDSAEPPIKISTSPGWFKCKFCDHLPVCHGKDLPSINCRTCTYSTPIDNGEWRCELNAAPVLIPVEKQLTACDNYSMLISIKS